MHGASGACRLAEPVIGHRGEKAGREFSEASQRVGCPGSYICTAQPGIDLRGVRTDKDAECHSRGLDNSFLLVLSESIAS